MKSKLSIGILFGGKSAEHEISLRSAQSIVSAVDRDKYDVVLIGIDRQGVWRLCDPGLFAEHKGLADSIDLSASKDILLLCPGEKGGMRIRTVNSPAKAIPVDVIFPVLHGTFGEDGTVQGLLKLLDVPFAGAGVMGSAAGMDKDVMKRLLNEAGIPNARYICVNGKERNTLGFSRVREILGNTVFIKPANLGSSVGVSKVRTDDEFIQALDEAFAYDRKIIIEEEIKGREVECSVIGNEEVFASLPGEIIVNADFYSYEAKYIDENGARLEIPARLPEGVTEKVRELAAQVFRLLCCEGFARVDFFVRENNEVVVNEINTLPGFTRISMYPKLMEISGFPFNRLIEELIRLALLRYGEEKKIQTNLCQMSLSGPTEKN